MLKIENAKICGDLLQINRQLKEELKRFKEEKVNERISALNEVFKSIKNKFVQSEFEVICLSDISFTATYKGLNYQVYFSDTISVCRDEQREVVISMKPASRGNKMKQEYNTVGYLTEEIIQLEKENRELRDQIASVKNSDYSYWVEGDDKEYSFIDKLIERIFN